MIIKILDSVEDYKEAIKVTCDTLEENESVTSSYYRGIIDKIDEFGSYFCLDNIAMPHARPEDGALKTDLCVLKLNQATDFLGKSVNVFFTFCAPDSNSHVDILKLIADVCSNKDKLDTIVNAKSEVEIMEVM